ncbi:MAG: EVE domain-containing protein [Pyrinomonadaceae bacterium]|nr:EVE domain-containing protein [Pyrinomonadaceae bacterium]
MNHWLMKEEPKKCTFEEFEKDGKRVWKKVKNYQARNFIREMEKGDLVLFYNSGDVKAVQGVAKVISDGGYESPEDERWTWVDIEPVEKFKNEVTLAQIKADDFFEGLKLIKQTRLSVMPVSNAHFDKILSLSAG